MEVDPRKIGQLIHGTPVIDLAGTARFRGALHLAAVGRRGGRERIRAEARARGLVDGVDLLAVA